MINAFLITIPPRAGFFLRKIKKKLTQGIINGLIAAVAQIAQSVEQGIENPRVGGSIPSLGTI